MSRTVKVWRGRGRGGEREGGEGREEANWDREGRSEEDATGA